MLSTILSLVALNNLIAPSENFISNKPEYLSESEFLTSHYTKNLYPPPKSISAHPVKTGLSLKPEIKAKAVISIDLDTGTVLYGHNQNDALPMASLTKLMTIFVILKENNIDETVIVDKRATTVEPSKIYLLEKEKIKVSELIKAILIKSANDAALALAYHNAGEIDSFVEKMNREAQKIGLTQTHFKNPTGLDQSGQFASPTDLAILARSLYKYPIVQQAAPLESLTITSTDQKQTHKLENTNSLLGSYLKVLGLKTGTTDEAGQCLITIVENSHGNRIINIILNSPARFQESKILSQWIFNNYSWI